MRGIFGDLMERSPLHLALDLWHAVPLKLVCLLVVLSLVLKNPDGKAEYYPFSNYPMYSNFDSEDFFVYLADQDGKALPSKETFRITAAKVKKRFNSELEEVAVKLKRKKSSIDGEALEKVGVATLNSLTNPVFEHPRMQSISELQLIYVELKGGEGKIVSNERMLASIPISK